MDPAIAKTQEIMDMVSQDEEMLHAYHMFQLALSDEANVRNGERRQGREEGRKEGREEGLKEGRKEGRDEGLKEGLEKGIEKGMKEGLEKGLEKGREEIIELIRKGYSPDDIEKMLSGKDA
jgi:flagellar biosynthesis/type III secretory pathway protein FliH